VLFSGHELNIFITDTPAKETTMPNWISIAFAICCAAIDVTSALGQQSIGGGGGNGGPAVIILSPNNTINIYNPKGGPGGPGGNANNSSVSPGQSVDSSCLVWVPSRDGQVPDDPVAGGQEPAWPLYICRTKLPQGAFPGKLIRGWACYVAEDGNELAARQYDVLTGASCPMEWRIAPSGVFPANPIQGGIESEQPSFICRAEHAGGLHIGRVGWATNHKCVISYGGRQFNYDQFEVLTTKSN
jgi:hypothetical protein